MASRVAAVVAPLCVLAVAFAWLGGEVERPRTEGVVAMEAALAAAPPEVVVLGNSKVLSDIDAKALGTTLGAPGHVSALQVPASTAPAWYALLEQRVVNNGYTPKLVVLYGTLAGLLATDVPGALDQQRLADQRTGESPALDQKLGGSSGFWARVRRNATAAHQAWSEGVRDLAVGLLLAPPGEDLATAGHAVAAPALDTLFGASATFVPGARARVIPVVEGPARLKAPPESDPAASLLPDFVALASAHGAKVVFVRAPLPPGARYLDAVPVARERAAITLMNSLGMGYVDLRALPLPTDGWQDDLHATMKGKALVTAALGTTLSEADVLGGGALPPGRMPVVPTSLIRVASAGTGGPADAPAALSTGAPVRSTKLACAWQLALPGYERIADDALVEAGLPAASPVEVLEAGAPLGMHAVRKGFGEACTGAALHTRSALLVSPRAETTAPQLTARLSPALPLTDAAGEPIWWVYPGTTMRFSFDEAWDRGAFAVEARVRLFGEGGATLSAAGAEAPFTRRGRIHVARVAANAPAGPWSITIAATEGAWIAVERVILGTDEPMDLLGAAMPSLSLLGTPVTWAAPAPTFTVEAGFAALPGLEAVTDEATRARIGLACSPVRLGGAGGPTAETSTLNPTRKCGSNLWLYPGDHARFAPAYQKLAQLRLGADELELTGATFGEADASVTVRIRERSRAGDGRVLYTGKVTFPAAGAAATHVLSIDPPLPSRAIVDIEVERATDPAFVLLRSVVLRASESTEGAR